MLEGLDSAIYNQYCSRDVAPQKESNKESIIVKNDVKKNEGSGDQNWRLGKQATIL